MNLKGENVQMKVCINVQITEEKGVLEFGYVYRRVWGIASQ